MIGGPIRLAGIAAVAAACLCAPGSASAVSILGDFDGDGRDDLAVFSSGSNASDSSVNGGHVNVLYGSQRGLGAAGNQLFSQASPGVLGSVVRPTAGNNFVSNSFGHALAAGDFDGDGRDELAVSAFEYENAKRRAGRVIILEGTANGLAGNGESWDQDTPSIQGTAVDGDEFGHALATADFDADGIDDLAIGVPGEDCGAIEACGAAAVILGDEGDGLTATDNALIGQETTDVEGVPEENDQLGYSVEAGDFNGDTLGDLAVGTPHEGVGTGFGQGAVNVLYGSSNIGIVVAGDQIFTDADVSGGSSADGISFAHSLAAGDFDGDNDEDLASGVPGFPGTGGAVGVLYGTGGGLATGGSEHLSQDSAGVPDTGEAADQFGVEIEAGDLDADGAADLAVGAPTEDVAKPEDGAAYLLYGFDGAGGLSGTGATRLAQKGKQLPGGPDNYDFFGNELAIGNFDKDGSGDLAVGAPADRIRRNGDGSVTVVYGPQPSSPPNKVQLWHRDRPGIKGKASKSFFGYALTGTNLNFAT